MTGLVDGRLAAAILLHFAWPETVASDCAPAYRGRSKLELLFGADVWSHFRNRYVIDFGCGEGRECAEIAAHGAQRVIELRTAAQRNTARFHNVEITGHTNDKADINSQP
jgi:hypothetical protein